MEGFLPRPPMFRAVQRPLVPAGLEALYNACHRIYPDQPNPLQVAALLKFWLNGPDPLDYVSMFSNPGNPNLGIEPHWHYISFGLSDLHGDGRVHEPSGPGGQSGFGFELTFRLEKQPDERAPPTWPAAIMQALAKYIFQSGNSLCSGDHVTWHCPLDNSESRIQHMLMLDDPQLGTVHTPNGSVAFLQIVGVFSEELKAAQDWNVHGILDLMRGVSGVGGPWLITSMRRRQSIFELDPQIQDTVDRGIEVEGSNLSGVSAKCSWEECRPEGDQDDEEDGGLVRGFSKIPVQETEQIKEVLKKGLQDSGKSPLLSISSNQCYSMCNVAGSQVDSEPGASQLETRYLDSVHIQFNLEAGLILPLALKGRLMHGKHFTFKSSIGDVAITLVPESVIGAFVDVGRPFGVHGPWLQVLLTSETIESMLADLVEVSESDELVLPKTFQWCSGKFLVTLMTAEFN